MTEQIAFMMGYRYSTVTRIQACWTARQQHGHSYELCRQPHPDSGMQEPICIATFDANEPDPYNEENCKIAARLFQNQSGVIVGYRCREKG